MIIGIGHSHIRRMDRANRRQVRKMASAAMRQACRKVRAKGFKPISAVDDLTLAWPIGNWINDFAHGLTAAARQEGISIVGGEMAQMAGSYRKGFVGVVVYVVGL